MWEMYPGLPIRSEADDQVPFGRMRSVHLGLRTEGVELPLQIKPQ